MASTCISICVNDARAPVRATYINLYKWPESDFEFVRSMSSNNNLRKDINRDNIINNKSKYNMHGHPRVVDSYSCRQLYLRSYTFSREEDHRRDDEEERSTIKCLGKKVADDCNDERGCDVGKRRRRRRNGTRKSLKRAKSVSCSVVESIFRRLLSCTTKVDVVN